MAKINWVKRKLPSYHRVHIEINDPECTFSISPHFTVFKVFHAPNVKKAISAAKSFCTKYNKMYPKAAFTYSKEGIEPYSYTEYIYRDDKDITISRHKY